MIRLLRGGPTLWIAQKIVRTARARWRKLPDQDRRELGRLVRKSRGRRDTLTGGERDEVGRIVRRYFGRDRVRLSRASD